MIIFEIKNPKADESTPEAFRQILANVASQSPVSLFNRLVRGHRDPVLYLEIAMYQQAIHFYIVCEDYLRSYFNSQLTAQYPTAQIIPAKDYLPLLKSSKAVSFGQMKLRNVYYYPLTTFRNFREKDPMGSMLGILSKLGEEETGLIQITLLPAGTGWQTGARRIVDNGILDPQTKRRKPLPHERTITEKIMANGLRTSIRLFISASSVERADMLINDLAGSYGVVARGDGNALEFHRPGIFAKKQLYAGITERKPISTPRFQILNVEELSTLFHPPTHALQGIKNITWGGQILSEAPENLPVRDLSKPDNHDTNYFAKAEFKNQMHVFGIQREDRRRHMYIIGKTGTGKSTMIANMAVNDMRNGEGVAIIDPHGDLCETILDYVPRNRINDVAYLDPSDVKHPFHLNPLELSQKGSLPGQIDMYGAELVASGIVSIFYKLYHYSWGPRMEYILRNALLTMTRVPGATLFDVVRILSEPSYRKSIVDTMDDKVLKNFWENEFNRMGDKLQAEAVAPIQNKIGQFVSSPLIRNIIGSPISTVNFSDMMDEGKIVICNLSQGKLGEDNAALLGAMFITKMQLAAMSRVFRHEHERRDFYLYVDEFQNFATTSFLKILSEARKYRLNLILANQYVGQIDLDVQKAIFGNVGSLVTFLVGAQDARALSFEFGENFSQNDFVNLDNYQILLKMAIDGRTSNPFYAQTQPLPSAKNKNRETIIRVSRERYSRSGYTLIELLVVTTIIMILTIAGLYWGVNAIQDAKLSHIYAQTNEVKRAYALYRTDTGTMPAWYHPQNTNPLTTDPGVIGWHGPYTTTQALPLVHPWKGHIGWQGEGGNCVYAGAPPTCPDRDGNGGIDFIIVFDDDRPGMDQNDNGGRIPRAQMLKYDQKTDDGNLSTGKVQGNGEGNFGGLLPTEPGELMIWVF